jgi:hypothetical protein
VVPQDRTDDAMGVLLCVSTYYYVYTMAKSPNDDVPRTWPSLGDTQLHFTFCSLYLYFPKEFSIFQLSFSLQFCE